jgi:ABC-type dipeptide/oligopeptide/nickel transport system permease component
LDENDPGRDAYSSGIAQDWVATSAENAPATVKVGFVYKYLFAPVWIGGFAVGIAATWNQADEFSHNWSRGAAIMVAHASFWLILLMVRLKSVEANRDGLVLGSQQIPYDQIDWVYEIAFVNPPLISLKHTNPKAMESKKILIIPAVGFSAFQFLSERPMTRFLRQMIMKANPDYSRDNEPSRFMPLVIVMVTAMPIVFLVSQYLGPSNISP